MKTEKNYPIVHTNKDKLFTFVERAKNEVIICVGNHIVSSVKFKTLKDAKDYTERKPWELLVNVICLTFQKMKDYEKESNAATQE